MNAAAKKNPGPARRILATLGWLALGSIFLLGAISALKTGEALISPERGSNDTATRDSNPIAFWCEVLGGLTFGTLIVLAKLDTLVREVWRLVRGSPPEAIQDSGPTPADLERLQDLRGFVNQLPAEDRTDQEDIDKRLVAKLRSPDDIPTYEEGIGRKSWWRPVYDFPAFGAHRETAQIRFGIVSGGSLSLGRNVFKIRNTGLFSTGWVLERSGEACAQAQFKHYGLLGQMRDALSASDEELISRNQVLIASSGRGDYYSVQANEMHLSLVPSPFAVPEGDSTHVIVADGNIVGSIQTHWPYSGWFMGGQRFGERCRVHIQCDPSVAEHLQLFLLWLTVNRNKLGRSLGSLADSTRRPQPGVPVTEATFKCGCEHCDGHLEAPAEAAGRVVECPHCHQNTQLRRPAAPLPATLKTVIAPAASVETGSTQPTKESMPRSWLTTFFLAFLLGGLGVDRFYNGRIGLGIGKLLTGGACGLWSLTDVLLLLFAKYQDAQANYLRPAKRSHLITAWSVASSAVLLGVVLVGSMVRGSMSHMASLGSGSGESGAEIALPDGVFEERNAGLASEEGGRANPGQEQARPESPERARSSEAPTPTATAQRSAPGGNSVLDLDGATAYFEIPADAFTDLTEATVECRVKWNRFQHMSRVFDFAIGTQLVAMMNRESGPNLYAVAFPAGKRRSVEVPGALQADRWTHLALTVGPDQLTLFVDANPAPQKFRDGPDTVRSSEFTRRNLVGLSNAKAVWPRDQFFAGQLDELRVWNRILTPAEIEAGMNANLTGNEPGLAGWWNFNDPTNAGHDSSSGGHHGTLMGAATIMRLQDQPVTVETGGSH